jgi:hypothetical protein
MRATPQKSVKNTDQRVGSILTRQKQPQKAKGQRKLGGRYPFSLSFFEMLYAFL